jgi:hypothetical protein
MVQNGLCTLERLLEEHSIDSSEENHEATAVDEQHDDDDDEGDSL